MAKHATDQIIAKGLEYANFLDSILPENSRDRAIVLNTMETVMFVAYRAVNPASMSTAVDEDTKLAVAGLEYMTRVKKKLPPGEQRKAAMKSLGDVAMAVQEYMDKSG